MYGMYNEPTTPDIRRLYWKCLNTICRGYPEECKFLRDWAQFASASSHHIAGIVSLCYKGSKSPQSIGKVVRELTGLVDMSNSLSQESVRGCYEVLRFNFPRGYMMHALMNTLGMIYTAEVNQRISLVIKQSANQGLASLTITLGAIRAGRDCPVWQWLSVHCVPEWQVFINAAQELRRDPYGRIRLRQRYSCCDLCDSLPVSRIHRNPAPVSSGCY